ncbi:MAG: DUF4373 domain-containing protein [Ignavibacteriaceae bacterium]
MAKDAYYFSHDSNSRNDEKILSLRMKLGMEGYGIYWAIIEMLRDSTDYRMQLQCERIAFELHTDNETIKSVINDFNLFDNDTEYFWSESLLRRMEIREQKSNKARESAKVRWDKAKAMRTQSERNAKKGKEIKEKEIKGNKKTENNIPDFEEFLIYAKTIEIYHSSFDFQIKTKYDTWVDDKWKTGVGKKIINWKNTLRSTMPYFQKDLSQIEKQDYTQKVL